MAGTTRIPHQPTRFEVSSAFAEQVSAIPHYYRQRDGAINRVAMMSRLAPTNPDTR
jgi:hypothetical protein